MFLDDVITLLVDAGVGVAGVNIFAGSSAKIPSTTSYPSGDTTKGMGPYLSVIETGGVAPTRTQNVQGAATQRPTAQILVRAGIIVGTQEAYTAARDMATEAYNTLDNLDGGITVNGIVYISVGVKQEPTDIGLDATGQRVQIVFNIGAEKQPS